MKHIVLSSIILVITVSGCLKNMETIYEDVLPQLKFEVLTNTGIPVSGAYVYLYEYEDDWKENINPVKKGQTDIHGNLVIIGLNEEAYYFYIEKGTMTNLYDVSQLEKPLKKNTIASIRVVIK